MFVLVSCADPADVGLEDAANCRELHVTTIGCPDMASVARALVLAGAGTLTEDGTHAWLSVEWLRRHGSATQPGSWAAEFGAMLDYAASQGWLDTSAETVRAHLRSG